MYYKFLPHVLDNIISKYFSCFFDKLKICHFVGGLGPEVPTQNMSKMRKKLPPRKYQNFHFINKQKKVLLDNTVKSSSITFQIVNSKIESSR